MEIKWGEIESKKRVPPPVSKKCEKQIFLKIICPWRIN